MPGSPARHGRRLLPLAAVALALLAAPASGAGPRVRTYHVPAGSNLHTIAAGPDGGIWFTEYGRHAVGRLGAGGGYREVALPGASPDGIAAGPDGAVWVSEYVGGFVDRIAPDGTVSRYRMPATSDVDARGAQNLAAGADGALWYTDAARGRIGRVTPGGAFTEWTLADSAPYDLALGPDGAIWFTDLSHAVIGRIAPDGTARAFGIGVDRGMAAHIVRGPDGAMWFTEPFVGRVGRIGVDGRVRTFDAGTVEVTGIATGADRALYVTEDSGGPPLTRVTTHGALTPFGTIPAGLTDIALGPDRALWALAPETDEVLRIVPPPPVRCVVPRLRGRTLGQARVRLRTAHCALGHVTRTSHRAPLRIRRQGARPGSRHAPGFRVAVTLAHA